MHVSTALPGAGNKFEVGNRVVDTKCAAKDEHSALDFLMHKEGRLRATSVEEGAGFLSPASGAEKLVACTKIGETRRNLIAFASINQPTNLREPERVCAAVAVRSLGFECGKIGDVEEVIGITWVHQRFEAFVF